MTKIADFSDLEIGPDGYGISMFYYITNDEYVPMIGIVPSINQLSLFGSEWMYYAKYTHYADPGAPPDLYDYVIGTDGIDTYNGDTDGYFSYAWFDMTFYGMGGDDRLFGERGNETFYGGDGNDQLSGGSGANTLDGGDGNDIIFVGGGSDTVSGGAGFDAISYHYWGASVWVDLTLWWAVPGVVLAQMTGVEGVQGSLFDDTIKGDSAANHLNGHGGDDILIGRLGADELIGDSGFDRADYIDSAAAVTVDLLANTGSGGEAAGDTFSGIEGIRGSAYADVLTGDAGANTLWGHDGDDGLAGGAGNDLLYGETGADTLQGGDGDDMLVGGSEADVLDGGAGIDTANYAEAGAGVALSLVTGGTGGIATGDSFIGVENVLGSTYGDDLILGNADANMLRGLFGADRLYGGAGGDMLVGDAGNDVLYGEAGGDQIDGGDGDDYLTGGAGADALAGGNGTDIVLYDSAAAAVTVDLVGGTGGGDAAGDTYSNLEYVIGSAYGDAITGNAATNALWGLAGDDVLTGGGGGDALKGGAGADRFVYTAVSDSTTVIATRDSINDFSHAEGDRLDLSAVDADGNAGNGDTAFTFLGGGAFTGAGREIRVVASGNVQTIQADVDGDIVADMQINIVGAIDLVAGDLVL